MIGIIVSKILYKEKPNFFQVLFIADETHQILIFFPEFAKLSTLNN
jgi:hypothetical protein